LIIAVGAGAVTATVEVSALGVDATTVGALEVLLTVELEEDEEVVEDVVVTMLELDVLLLVLAVFAAPTVATPLVATTLTTPPD
jgi:hypothetical protein